jgi:hypothetical protein
LAINAVAYGLGVAWERRLVTHQLDACQVQQAQDEEYVILQEAA